jgi:hypothetical protein
MAEKRKSRRFVCDKTATDLACEDECQVCRYLNFLQWAGAVGKPDGSVIQRDEKIDAWLREKAPHLL